MERRPIAEDLATARRAAARVAPRAIPLALVAGVLGGLASLPPLGALVVGILIGPPIARAVRGDLERASAAAGALTLLLVGLLGAASLLPGLLFALLLVTLVSGAAGLLPVALLTLLGLAMISVSSLGLALYVLARLGIATPAAVAGDAGPLAAISLSWRRLGDGGWRGQLARRLIAWGLQLPLIGIGLLVALAVPPLATIAGVLASVIGDLFGRSLAQAYYERVRG